MSKMPIESKDTSRIVTDYEFVMVSGVNFPINIDLKAGDKIAWEPEQILITLSAKPGIVDSSKVLPRENITLYRKHIAVIHTRERIIRDVTAKEKIDLDKTISSLLNSDPETTASETN